MTIPLAHVEHAIQGRLRVRVPSRRDDAAYFMTTASRLREYSPVISVRANPLTGSLLISHHSDLDAISAHARGHNLFDLQPVRSPVAEVEPHTPPMDNLRLLAMGVMAAALNLLGAYQATRQGFESSASEGFWHAYMANTQLRKPWLAAVLGLAGAYGLMKGRLLAPAPSLIFYAATVRSLIRGNPPAGNSPLTR